MIIFFHLALISAIAMTLFDIIGVGWAFLIGLSLSSALIVLSRTKMAAYRRNFSALYSGTPIYFVLALVCVHFMGALGLLVLPIVMAIVFSNGVPLLNGPRDADSQPLLHTCLDSLTERSIHSFSLSDDDDRI